MFSNRHKFLTIFTSPLSARYGGFNKKWLLENRAYGVIYEYNLTKMKVCFTRANNSVLDGSYSNRPKKPFCSTIMQKFLITIFNRVFGCASKPEYLSSSLHVDKNLRLVVSVLNSSGTAFCIKGWKYVEMNFGVITYEHLKMLPTT